MTGLPLFTSINAKTTNIDSGEMPILDFDNHRMPFQNEELGTN